MPIRSIYTILLLGKIDFLLIDKISEFSYRETRYGPDQELVQHYRSMLNDYIHEKDNIKAKSESKGQDAYTLTLEDVFDCAEALYDLKHTGHVLRELYNIQLKCLDSKGMRMF